MRRKLLILACYLVGTVAYLLLTSGPMHLSASPGRQAAEENIIARFSPEGGCTEAVVAELRQAASAIDVQAYLLSSEPIVHALIDARTRGVKVRVMLDKAQRVDRTSGAPLLARAGVTVCFDDQYAVAHNKVMLIDGRTLITGSFNFTRAAEEKNAENVLVIHDHPKLIGAYQANFEAHFAHSLPYHAQ